MATNLYIYMMVRLYMVTKILKCVFNRDTFEIFCICKLLSCGFKNH